MYRNSQECQFQESRNGDLLPRQNRKYGKKEWKRLKQYFWPYESNRCFSLS